MLELKEKYSYRGLHFRLLKEDDVTDKYLQWITDPEVNEYLVVKYSKHTLQSLREYVKSFKGDNSRFLFGIYTDENQHIGNFSIYGISQPNKTFDFGYFIGEKEWWGRDAGMISCLIGLKIAFETLELRKTFTYVESINLKSRFVLQKIGFEKEAVLKERVLNKEKYVDSVIYSLDVAQWMAELKGKFQI